MLKDDINVEVDGFINNINKIVRPPQICEEIKDQVDKYLKDTKVLMVFISSNTTEENDIIIDKKDSELDWTIDYKIFGLEYSSEDRDVYIPYNSITQIGGTKL